MSGAAQAAVAASVELPMVNTVIDWNKLE